MRLLAAIVASLAVLVAFNAALLRWLDKSLAADSRWFETYMVFGLLYNRTGEYE